MTLLVEPMVIPAPSKRNIRIAPAHRQVQLVVDAWCELAPDTIDTLGITILNREAMIDSRSVTLNHQQTLHHSCWPQPPRRIEWLPTSLGERAQIYRTALANGMSVLALHRPSALDEATRMALAARTITLAGRSTRDDGLRIAVYELTHVGAGFGFLAEAAARAAADSMPLHQLLTLLDRMQAAMRSFYLTGMRGPHETMCQANRGNALTRFGNQQWELDAKDGLFARRAGGWNVAATLPQTPMAEQASDSLAVPTVVLAQPAALLDRLNTQRVAQQQPALARDPGGASLTPLFPHGCIELAHVPDTNHIHQIIDVIRRIDRSAVVPTTARRRGAVL